MKPAELLNKRSYNTIKISSYILKRKLMSMIAYLISRKVFNNQVKLWFYRQNFKHLGMVYQGAWVLKFNRCQRYFTDLFSVYWFLKEVMEKIDDK